MDFSGATITCHGAHRLDVSAWGCGLDHTGPILAEGEAQYPNDGPFDAPTIARFELKYASGVTFHCHTEPGAPGPAKCLTRTLFSGLTNGSERNDLTAGNYANPDDKIPPPGDIKTPVKPSSTWPEWWAWKTS